jgi:hypothetical protein
MQTSTMVDSKMSKIVVGIVLVTIFWHPLQPFRHVTADALSLAADIIRD